MNATIPQSPSRPALNDAEFEVQRTPCSLCGAPPLEICQRQSRAEHLQRWIDTFQAGRITCDQIAEVFAQVVILTKWQTVPECAA